jgi:putative transcriptional regulator
MNITHHPAPESLMSCSAGSMPEAFAAVMASHIAMCPTCRGDLAVMEQIGTVLFEAIASTPVSGAIAVDTVRDAGPGRGDEKQWRSDGSIPQPLVKALGNSLDQVSWTHIGPGIWQHQIALSHRGRGSLRLIKVDPGRSLPEHGHSGSELTLVLRGAFRDGSGSYNVGDVADIGQDVEHAPIADVEAGCICLVATEGQMRFKGRIARLVQRFVGL